MCCYLYSQKTAHVENPQSSFLEKFDIRTSYFTLSKVLLTHLSEHTAATQKHLPQPAMRGIQGSIGKFIPRWEVRPTEKDRSQSEALYSLMAMGMRSGMHLTLGTAPMKEKEKRTMTRSFLFIVIAGGLYTSLLCPSRQLQHFPFFPASSVVGCDYGRKT